MSMRVSFEISDKDLSHFRQCMQRARHAVRDADDSEIIDAAEQLFEEVHGSKAPAFVSSRLARLESMVKMLRDEDWALPSVPRNRVLCALVYFCDPEDLIPDSIPGLGYLDDAIMIEMVCRELKHEIQAYRDFCVYRAAESSRQGREALEVDRTDWLEERRKQLHSRMRRRRSRGKGGGHSPFSLF